MKNIGIFVGEEKWTFFKEIYGSIAAHYETEIYRPITFNTPLLYGRLNRWAFKHRIRSMLRRHDICFFEWASELLVHASHMPKCCAIVTRLHSFELYEWTPKVNWNCVDKIIFVSRAMERKFIESYPDQRQKTVVVYNGRSLTAFQPPVRRKFGLRLGMLCDIKPIKRIYEVILAIHDICKKGYNAFLEVAGNPVGPDDMRYAAALHRLVERLGLQNRVRFEGYVANTAEWLSKIDVFISNSFWEGQQVALIEAMATGCYCLCHDWDGAREMVPEQNLFTTDAEFQHKIIEYAEMPDTEKMKHHAGLRADAGSKFDIERTKADILNIIRMLEI